MEPKTNNYQMLMNAETHNAIRDHIGQNRAERGGMLGRDSDGVIRHFEADHKGRCNAAAYDPDIDYLNGVIKGWKTKGIEFCGFVHSHPPGLVHPSGHDRWYAGEILSCFKRLEYLVIPIVQTIPDTGRFEIFPYIAMPEKEDRKQCNILKTSLTVLEGLKKSGYFPTDNTLRRQDWIQKDVPLVQSQYPEHSSTESKKAGSQTTWRYYGNFEHSIWKSSPLNPNQLPAVKLSFPAVIHATMSQSFRQQAAAMVLAQRYTERQRSGVDLESLDQTRLILIGAGGGSSLIRNSARMGFGEFVICDHDQVSDSNIATQQAEPDAIGLPKVEALANDLVRLNPAASVLAIAEGIETIDDQKFSLLINEPLRFRHFAGINGCTKTILLVLTDNFEAQARGHRLGLQFGLPTICAQEYREGRGAEVTFTVPGVTPACHRCITASRYSAYLKEGYRNNVTSAGAPIFAAEMLNAVLGHILLAVAHHGTSHPRWGSMIDRLGSRNLIRVRMDPDFDQFFGDTFNKRLVGAKNSDCFFMLDSLFLPQTPDFGQTPSRPVCPDCGGTGDLRYSIGTFDDTTIMRQDNTDYECERRVRTAQHPKYALTAYESARRTA
ncbi:MAG: hypothetical protein A2511_12410 [Deltaproteobacteria bacterium RIFOXYD12_FULL_50_9]|nr:MAG: hypothetical protein A2511_12410 [Deltaproteobacteria bacterium RIFOXYD12_FULL_50_9]